MLLSGATGSGRIGGIDGGFSASRKMAIGKS